MSQSKKCQKCQSTRILDVCGHTSDSFDMQYKDKDYDGYVPHDLNIGGGDDIELKICIDCGQLQGKWPISEKTILTEFDGDDEDQE